MRIRIQNTFLPSVENFTKEKNIVAARFKDPLRPTAKRLYNVISDIIKKCAHSRSIVP